MCSIPKYRIEQLRAIKEKKGMNNRNIVRILMLKRMRNERDYWKKRATQVEEKSGIIYQPDMSWLS